MVGIPYTVENEASRINHIPVYKGTSDANGIIKIEQLHWLDLTLVLDSQKLADEMETRVLGVKRNPLHQPQSAKPFTKRSEDATENYKSDIQVKAESDGFLYRYVTIGELCDKAPTIKDWDQPALPEFHFPPQRSLKGHVIEKKYLNNRVVIEICPFRVWVLDLHDTQDYSLANGLNLGIMADLAYSDQYKGKLIENFFDNKCLDLSEIPHFADYPSFFHTLSIDVPFSQRYTSRLYMNTRDEEQSEGDTRVFYAECSKYIIVAWCGTDSLLNGLTNASFAPKKCPEGIVESGSIHGGFLDAYNLAKVKFQKPLTEIENKLTTSNGTKSLFVCGHSLGGALALIFAAEMKSISPVLYTYGMPRTFTTNAIKTLSSITHYRHVNDNDTVTQIPPDADLNNFFYEKFGPLGEQLGFNWAAITVLGLSRTIQQLGRQVIGTQQINDPYWHHGNIVIFLQAQQCVMKKGHQYQPWIGGGGKDNPTPGVIYTCDYAAVKLYLVPSLNMEYLLSSGERQKSFIQSIGKSSLEAVFPHNSNPTLYGLLSSPWSHSMAHRYLPYIHNQVLELADPSRNLMRKENRNEFVNSMGLAAESGSCDQNELQRNKIFMKLQNMLPATLNLTLSGVTGQNALARYANVTEEVVEISK